MPLEPSPVLAFLQGRGALNSLLIANTTHLYKVVFADLV